MLNEQVSTPRGIVNLLPWLRHVPGDPCRTKPTLEQIGKILDFLREIVEEHRKTYDGDNIRDYIDAYLAEQKNRLV